MIFSGLSGDGKVTVNLFSGKRKSDLADNEDERFYLPSPFGVERERLAGMERNDMERGRIGNKLEQISTKLDHKEKKRKECARIRKNLIQKIRNK